MKKLRDQRISAIQNDQVTSFRILRNFMSLRGSFMQPLNYDQLFEKAPKLFRVCDNTTAQIYSGHHLLFAAILLHIPLPNRHCHRREWADQNFGSDEIHKWLRQHGLTKAKTRQKEVQAHHGRGTSSRIDDHWPTTGFISFIAFFERGNKALDFEENSRQLPIEAMCSFVIIPGSVWTKSIRCLAHSPGDFPARKIEIKTILQTSRTFQEFQSLLCRRGFRFLNIWTTPETILLFA